MNRIDVLKDIITTKDGRKFTKLVGGFGEGCPILTDKQVGELLGYKKGARMVREQFDRNRDKFEENVDFIDLIQRVSDSDTLNKLGYSPQSIKQAKNIYIFSQAGFLKYLKIATSEESFVLYEDFIEDYFKTKVELKVAENTLQEELEKLENDKIFIYGKSVLCNNENDSIELLRKLEDINNRITDIKVTLSKEDLEIKYNELITNYNKLVDDEDCFDIGEFSKVLDIKGFGRNKLYEYLRDTEIFMRNKNVPYSKYSNYFKMVFSGRYKGVATYKPLLKGKGIPFLLKRLRRDGILEDIDTKKIKEIENNLRNMKKEKTN